MIRQLVQNMSHLILILISMPFRLITEYISDLLLIQLYTARLDTTFLCQQLIWHQRIALLIQLHRTHQMSHNRQKKSRPPVYVQSSVLMRATTNTRILTIPESAIAWSQETYWTSKTMRHKHWENRNFTINYVVAWHLFILDNYLLLYCRVFVVWTFSFLPKRGDGDSQWGYRRVYYYALSMTLYLKDAKVLPVVLDG